MEITFNPTKKQFTAWEYLTDQTTTELGYGGAASGGKSYLGCVWITTMCLAYPETQYLIGRKELVNLKRTTLRTLYKVFKSFDITEKHYTYNQQTNTLEFGNGSKIVFLDLGYKPSDPLYTRLGGLELTGAFIDESNEVTAEAIDILKTRIGRQNNDKYDLLPKLFETFNPAKNHVYQRYYKPYKDGSLPAHRRFIQALPQDNPYTPASYIEQLKNADKVTRMRMLEGNFEYDDDPATLMKFNSIVDIFTNTIQKRDEKYISVDVARLGKDTTVIMLWEDLEVTKITVLEKTTLDVTAEKIKAIASENRVPFSHIIIDEDGVGGGVVDMLGGVVGFVANSVPRKIDTGIKDERPLNYSNLKSQCYFTLANYVNKHRLTVQIHDIIIREKIVEELEQIKQKDIDKDGKLTIIPKDKMKEALGRSPDFADALMMRMYFELGKAMNVGIHIPRHNINRKTITSTI
jgi:hypothetical protein